MSGVEGLAATLVQHCLLMLQAILPLRGKILNVERKEESSMLKNNEITSLVVALGLGVKVSKHLQMFAFITGVL